MRTIDEKSITDAVLEQMASTPNPRLRQIMDAFVRHLHAAAREVDLTPEEWLEGIQFLTAVGHKCTPYRQEFVLLSDTLGFSALINALHDKHLTHASTKSSLLGPFYRQDSRTMKLGESIASHSKGLEICVYGRVLDAAGQPIPNASLEVWQADEEGCYDLQRDDPSQMELRGRFYTDAEGRYYLRTITPRGYSIPMDGPVGNMVHAQGRHGYRPAHVHFLVCASGYREVVTALYMAGDQHIETDTVFGVSESLIVTVNGIDPSSPFPNLPSVQFDFRLAQQTKEDVSSSRRR